MNNELTNEQSDALREILSIGAGNAATALFQMIRERVDIQVPEVKLCRIEDGAEIVGGAENLVAAVTLKLLGDATGVLLFLFEKNDAIKFANILLGEKRAGTKTLAEMGQSALKETSTILSGAYLAAMSKVLTMRFLVSSPQLTQDMAGAIIDDLLIGVSGMADQALIMETQLFVKREKVKAYFMFMPDKDSLKKILSAMGVWNSVES